MSQTTSDRRRRRPTTWWRRLLGWTVALAVLVATALLAVERGTFGATTHTTASARTDVPSGEPAAVVTEVARHGANAYLAGSVVAEFDTRGVVVRDALSGDERWRYTRSDSAVCAQQASAGHVVLVYANGSTCAEAIALDPVSGARQWQRTLEAGGENRVVLDEAGFLSVDPAKMIVYESAQGFERFTLDNSLGHDTEVTQSSCTNVDAAGQSMVVTLQRCRSGKDAPWVEQLVVNSPSDGKPREDGRSYLSGIDSPSLIGATADGTSFVRDSAGAVYMYPLGYQQSVPITGLPALTGDANVVADRGIVVISDATTAYGLDLPRTGVAWSVPIVAPPSEFGSTLYIPTSAGIQLRGAGDGELLRTIDIALPEDTESVVVSGQLVGVRGPGGLTILR